MKIKNGARIMKIKNGARIMKVRNEYNASSKQATMSYGTTLE